MTIGAAILAAGASRRLGMAKQLLPYRGTTLLGAVARELCASRCERVAVVLGARAGEIAPTLVELPVEPLANVSWDEGMASSIRCAAGWAVRERLSALVIAVCDQPRLTADHVDRLIAAHRATRGAVASRYGAGPGVPVVIPACDYPRLFELVGDRGARCLLDHAHPIDWPDGLYDIDTAHDCAEIYRQGAEGS